ncbi:MAG: hypothetical protein ACREMV_07795 [Gemmatimonadales bacterium]
MAGPRPPLPPGQAVPEGLWTASGSAAAIFRLAPAQLSDIGERVPATRLTTAGTTLRTLVGVAFDRSGTMWITSSDDHLLLSFEPAALASSGLKAATTVIMPNAGSLSAPSGLAFDRARGLWVANFDNGTLVRFDSAQLAVGGAPAPAVVLSIQGNPTSLAFDRDGALWVSDHLAQTIAQYRAADLVASGSPAPAVVLTEHGNSLPHPMGLAFDADGDLWVANIGARNVVAFSPAQQAATGAPQPHVTLSSTGTSLSIPVGLAFDAEGSLWVVGGSGSLTKFEQASLGASGTPEPSARLTVPGHSIFWTAAFWPRPAALPLN